ncbi:30S ribosomal protein S21 [Geodia barretti]|uniref:30S ribosomal protein S21 n=1 Tax=Geodia barretti TaxID=519541 RepID=A0AA35T5S1_GEOBA|nr:30S ribosomal protein S21 [Geodia barretti]
MIHVRVEPDETIDRALARFKKICGKAGIVTEIRRRSFYEKPSEKRRRLELKRQRKNKIRTFHTK